MSEQATTNDPTGGLSLYQQIGIALNEPGAVLPRGRVYGRGGGPETVKSWQLRAIRKVLVDHDIDPHTTLAATSSADWSEEHNPDGQYMVWSHDAGTWWGPNGGAYTADITQAGRYTLAAAQDCASRRTWSSSTRPPEVVVAAPSPALLASPDLPRMMRERINKATGEAAAARRAAIAKRREEASADA